MWCDGWLLVPELAHPDRPRFRHFVDDAAVATGVVGVLRRGEELVELVLQSLRPPYRLIRPCGSCCAVNAKFQPLVSV